MTVTSDTHADAQRFERDWWGNCLLTYGEETKQLTYARLMGLHAYQDDGRYPVYDLAGASVIDMGGGPCSILLKTVNRGGHATVVDPCPYPAWVAERYRSAGISYVVDRAESYGPPGHDPDHRAYDEVWIYNVLQHVVDPELVLRAASWSARRLRIFEWIESETNVGHPHTLHADRLDRWIGGHGAEGLLNENGCCGHAYWGVFDL